MWATFSLLGKSALARENEEKDGLDEKQGEEILSSEIKMSTLGVT